MPSAPILANRLMARISMCARDIEAIRYSSYTDECCRALSAASEYTTDIYLIQLTHVHCLADKIGRSLSRDEWDLTSSTISAPIGACVRSMELELSDLKTSLVPQGRKFCPIPTIDSTLTNQQLF